MAKPQKDIDALAERVQRAIERERVLPKIAAMGADIDGVYKEAAVNIRKRLRATGFTESEVAKVINEELSGAIEKHLPKVEAAMREAALAGTEAQRQQFERIFGQSPEAATAALEAEVGDRPFVLSGHRRPAKHLRSLPTAREDSSPETD